MLTAVLSLGMNAQYGNNIGFEADTAKVILPWPQNVQEKLSKLMTDPLLESTQLGLLVYDLTADSAIFSYGARQTLRPASTMKLLTAVTAIDCLGSNYELRTSMYYTGMVRDSVLDGDIYLVGGMDPLFDDVDLQTFAERVQRLGIDSIHGHLVADVSFKEENIFGEGWCWDDDNARLSPLLVSRKDEFLGRFLSLLQQLGISTEDVFCTYGTLPRNAQHLYSRYHPLDELLYPMMKESDNLYAESLFFQIASALGHRPAKAVHARQAVKQMVSKMGFTGVPYKVTDGSGLSLYNYVTPELLVCLLRYAYHHRHIYMYLYPSLPVAGEDGTLKTRMTGSYTRGNVKAKTGTVTGVSSLAGYCRADSGHQLAFCIINQGVLKNSDGRDFQDRVCTALCEP